MEPRILAKSLDRIIKANSTHCETMPGILGGGKVWQFVTNETGGFVFMDTGEETVGIPTVSVSLVLDLAEEYDREDLLELLYANMALVDAVVCGMPSPVPDEDAILLLQHKVRMDAFDPEEFPKIVEYLIAQREILYSEDEDEDYDDDDEDDEIDDDEKPWGHRSR